MRAVGLPIVLFVLTLITEGLPATAADNVDLRSAILSITTDELRAHVDVLADDSFEGREAGTRGGHAAAGYLRDQFEKRGLKGGATDGSFEQPFGSGYRNILGVLPGSDPELRREFIVVGAHYDHVGYGNQANSFGPFGYVHNGADDNASGVSGLLEVVDAVTRLPQAPKRSILFAFWDGEEKGLLGSKHWVAYPTVAIDDVVFSINVDMIGRLRNDRLEVYGSRTSPGLRRLLSEINRDTGLLLDFNWEMKANSDHYAFFSSRIPVLMFHTGLHDDYHRPSDDAHLVNVEGMRRIARFLFNVLYDLGELPQPPEFRTDSELETPLTRRRLETAIGPPPPRLGVRWDPPDEEQPGLLLTEVEPNTAADRAGLRVGDRILEFGGRAINNSDEFRGRVLNSGSPVPMVIRRESEEKPLELTVELDGKPSRIGISWREDKSEPGTVILTRVIFGSPARLAGLRAKDRIYAIEGRQFSDSNGLIDLLTTLPGPIELSIERNGQLGTVELDVPSPRS